MASHGQVEMYDQRWQQHAVHSGQLLGDPCMTAQHTPAFVVADSIASFRRQCIYLKSTSVFSHRVCALQHSLGHRDQELQTVYKYVTAACRQAWFATHCVRHGSHHSNPQHALPSRLLLLWPSNNLPPDFKLTLSCSSRNVGTPVWWDAWLPSVIRCFCDNTYDLPIRVTMQAVAEGPRASDRFAAIGAACIAGLAATAGASDVAANFLAAVATRLEQAAITEDSLACINLTAVVAHLYSSGILQAATLYSFLDHLLNRCASACACQPRYSEQYNQWRLVRL